MVFPKAALPNLASLFKFMPPSAIPDRWWQFLHTPTFTGNEQNGKIPDT
jgi:hypothetical protein